MGLKRNTTSTILLRPANTWAIKSTPPKLALLALAITQAVALQVAQAATIEVTSNLDDGTDCTLREAIATVNAGGDQSNGCVIDSYTDALGTNDTITFSPGVSASTIITNGQLVMSKSVSINPGGDQTTIDANGTNRVMSIMYVGGTGPTVSMDQLTITGGNNNPSNGVSYNPDGVNGGGIEVVNANLNLNNSTVSGNTAGGNGGGISLFSSTVNVSNSTISGNSANYGGGIFTSYSPLVSLSNSTISGNSAAGNGGGISANTSTISVSNSTVSGNNVLFPSFNSNYIGGGISARLSPVSLRNSIVAGNRNSAFTSSTNADCRVSGTLIVGTDTISTRVCGGARVADPLHGPLQDNGGPTQTHALLAGSPAIDNGAGAGATTTDQRGLAAVGVRDSGAYEFAATENALAIDKLINHRVRETPDKAADLLVGTRYRSDYKVTNNSPNRIYRVRIFEDGQLICNLYDLMPGQSKQQDRCANFNIVLAGLNNAPANVTARVSGSSQILADQTDAYYTGFGNEPGKLKVTHYINEKNADSEGTAVTVNSNEAVVKFRVENTGSINLYRVKLYHDPASPVNSGWQELCFKGTLIPGEVRYCKRTIKVTHGSLNKVFGRAQGRDTNVGSGGVVNASNPTYFNVMLP